MPLKVIGIILILGISGCASLPQGQGRTEASSLSKDYESFRAPSSDTLNNIVLTEPTGALTLREALSLALMRNPDLRAFSWEVRAREAEALQAGLLPNPEIGSLLEDFGGTGSVEGFKGTETTVLLSQLVPLGGKISKKKRLATLNAELAGWDYEAAKLDVLTSTAKAFTNVLAAQRQLKLTEELAILAERVYDTVAEQVKAGEISPIQEKRAKVAFSQTKIRLVRARRELEAAKKELASKWGSLSTIFDKAEGNLDQVLPIPPYNNLAEFILQNPDVARWTTEMEQREAALKLEKAKAIPDPIVSGGYRHISEKDDNAFVVGLSIPIPVFNRNQGGILEAHRRISKSEEEKKNAEVTVNAFLAAAYRNLSSAYEEVQLLKNKVLPEAESAYNSIFEGYREGKFFLLDVLDAQKTLFDADIQYVQALQVYHLSLSDVERLTATPIEEIENYQKSNKMLNGNETKYKSGYEKWEQ